MRRAGRLLLGVLLLALPAGCATTPETTSGAGGTAFTEDRDLQRVWRADNFDFSGYDTLLIAETQADVPKLHPDGRENLEWARGVLRDEVATAVRAKQVFGTVTTRESDVRPGGRTLRLENTIVEYEKGGGGARYWAGLYGAGQPVIKVRGRVTDGDRPVFAFETRRSGVSAKARLVGGFVSDKEIQTEDIRDLATALATYIARTARRR